MWRLSFINFFWVKEIMMENRYFFMLVIVFTGLVNQSFAVDTAISQVASSLAQGQQVVNATVETVGVVDTTIGETKSLANSHTVGAQALAPEDQAEKSGSTAPITFVQRVSNLSQSIKANAALAAGVIATQIQSVWSWLKNKFNNDSSEYDKLMDDSFITTKAFLKEFLKGPKVSPDKMLSEIIQINKMLLKKLNHNNEEKDIYEKIVLKYQNNVFPLLLKQASNVEEPKGLFKKYQQNYLAIGRNFQDLLQQIMPEVSEKMLEFVFSVVNYASQQGAGLFLDDDSNKLDDDVSKYDKLISDMFAANMALSKKFLKASDDNMFSEIVEIQTAYLKLWNKHQAEIVEMSKEFLLKFQEGPVAAPFGKLPSINGTQSSASVVVPALAPGSQTANS